MLIQLRSRFQIRNTILKLKWEAVDKSIKLNLFNITNKIIINFNIFLYFNIKDVVIALSQTQVKLISMIQI